MEDKKRNDLADEQKRAELDEKQLNEVSGGERAYDPGSHYMPKGDPFGDADQGKKRGK